MILDVKNLTVKHKFGATAIQNLTFSAESGKIFCIYGQSESGKTSLLKALCGLLPVDNGTITLDDTDYRDKNIRDKNVFLLHEDLGFFENKTLGYNLEYPLRIRNAPNAAATIANIAKKYDLVDYLDIKVKKLSEQTRVSAAVMRCETRKADLYLFDNPFKNLVSREELFEKFLPIFRRKADNTVVIYATDSIKETEKINEKTLFLNYGIKHQIGKLDELRNFPSSVYVYKAFYPESNEREGVITENLTVSYDGNEYKLEKSALLNDIFVGKKVIVCNNGDKSTTRIYDKTSEKLIYFEKID